MQFFEFIYEDKDLGRTLDASASAWDIPAGTNWSSSDTFGI